MNPSDTVLYFVDETGDPGFGRVIITKVRGDYSIQLAPLDRKQEAPSRDYCIGWVEITEDLAIELENDLIKNWPKAWAPQSPPFEPKWKAIDGYGAKLRNNVVEGFLRIIEKYDFTLGAYYFNKVGSVLLPLRGGVNSLLRLSDEDIADVFSQIILLRAGHTLCVASVEVRRKPGAHARILHDRTRVNRMDIIRRAFRKACMNQPLETIEVFGKSIESNKEISFEDSENRPCIWLAEFAAREVSKLFRNNYRSRALRKLVPKFTKMYIKGLREFHHCVALDRKDGRSFLYDLANEIECSEIIYEFNLPSVFMRGPEDH